MVTKQQGSSKGKQAVATFIRLAFFYHFVLSVISIGSELLDLNAYAGIHSYAWAYGHLAWQAGIVLFCLLVFQRAEALADFICPDKLDLSIPGDMDAWTRAVLQFIGIGIIISGLASSGSLIVDESRASEVGRLYRYDLHFWSSFYRVLIEVLAGAVMVLFPAPLAKWLKARR